jgi:hypothetical protein
VDDPDRHSGPLRHARATPRPAVPRPEGVLPSALEAPHGELHGPFEVFADAPRRALTDALVVRQVVVQEAVDSLSPSLLAADLPANYVADLAFVRGGMPVVLELNPLYAAGYNVPAAHALLVVALGADLARRAGYAESTWAEILDGAAALAGERVEQCPAVWLLGSSARTSSGTRSSIPPS